MDKLDITNNYSLTNSYFLSSTTSTYHLEEEIDLNEILLEYRSLLSLTNDSEASSSVKKKKRPSTIIAGSHLNDDYCDISQIRREKSFLEFGNIVNDLHIFEKSYFRTENTENSLLSGRIEFSNSFNLSNDFKTITDSFEKIENESCPSWMNFSYDDSKSIITEYNKITPDIIISNVSENSVVPDSNDNKDNNDEFSIANSMNLLSVDNTLNFFTRRKKERYFLSPKKLIEKYKCVENTKIRNLSLNDDNQSKNSECDLEEYKFLETVQKLSNFCLEDVTIEWPALEDIDQDDSEFSFSTSTPKENENSFSDVFADLSPVKNVDEENNHSPSYGVSSQRYFSRRKGLKYFSTPCK
ncbi:uncharacterized protein LOC122507732 isoform X1 [Leptopilina heterotoma]|uniref:uncharacterized protein LOC122507732 isoform X1 n=1 Tax=Leptopilina heterotoma TaxID=63436 RepID=UPI001CAA077B|nr:uncharacterized protein LOC122507732 isoform X1 [Leptopilina heterotoma]